MDHLTPTPELYGLPFRIDDFHGMPFRYVGASGLRASAIGLGTWKFGLPATGDGARVDEPTAYAMLDRAIELGVTFWDTANRYNDSSGNSERLIGRWFAAHPGSRRDVVLATKLCGAMDGRTPNHCGLSRTNILDSVQASLERLRTDHVDLLYFHRPDPLVPVEESLETVEDLVRQGLVRYLAVSNVGVAELSEYLRVAGTLSRRVRPVAVQNRYNPLFGERDADRGTLAYAAAHGVAYVPFSPLARGLLTDRYLDPARVGSGDRLHDEGDLPEPATVERVRALGRLAAARSVSISQLTLAYLLSLPGMGPQIPSSSGIAQLESNAAAGSLELSAAERAEIAATLGVAYGEAGAN